MGIQKGSPVSSQTITLTLSLDLLAKIDEAAKANYCSRSDYLRASAVLRLNQQQITVEPVKAQEQGVVKQSEEEFLQELAERYT